MNQNKLFKYLVSILSILFIFCNLLLQAEPIVFANDSEAKVKVSLTKHYVPDIDNVLYPATSQFYTYNSTQGVGEFKITAPTIIKAYFNWDTIANVKLSGTAWLSKDIAGLDVIRNSIKLTKQGDSILVFLDPGTYYLHHFVALKSSSNNQSSIDKIKFGVALLAEDVNSDESIYESSYAMSNSLKLGNSKRGLLSTTSPIDYYKISIKEYSEVKISYNFEKTDDTDLSKALCTLYDSDNQKITSLKFNPIGEGKNVLMQMLEPGVYYITLSGATGATNIKVDAISYEVRTEISTLKWTNKNVVVSVLADFYKTEELLVDGKVQDNKVNDSKIWKINKDTCSEIKNSQFSVTKNGIYSIRVKDNNKKYILKRIKISNIDKISPSISGVKDGNTYKDNVIIKFWDKGGSGVKVATLDGDKIRNGASISEKGTHTLKVFDNAGNIKTVTFKIK